HGVLVPRARWRARVIVYGRVAPEPGPTGPTVAPRATGPEGPGVKSSPRAWSWAALMHRPFGIDVLACAHCGGRLRLIATLHDPAVIRKILAHLALGHSRQRPAPSPTPPSPRPARIGSAAFVLIRPVRRPIDDAGLPDLACRSPGPARSTREKVA